MGMDTDTADTPPPVDPYGTESDSESDSNALVNALIGGGAGILLSFVPGSTLLGGAVAGYLEGGDLENGLRVGGLAGLIMLVPFVLFGLFVFGIAGVAGSASFAVIAITVLLGGALYTIGLSIIGAAIGIALKDEL